MKNRKDDYEHELDSPGGRGCLEPRLPPELEREIFELTAISNLRHAPTLVRVARRVRTWIEPILYRVIIKADDGGSTSYASHAAPVVASTICSSPPTTSFSDHAKHKLPVHIPPLSYYAHHVRHLYLGQSVSTNDVSQHLSRCTNVQDLVLWTQNIGCQNECLGWLDGMTQLQRLSANLDDLFVISNGRGRGMGSWTGTRGMHRMSSYNAHAPWYKHPAFVHLTHLQITNVCSSWNRWKGLAQLPNLTHLALCLKFDLEVVKGVLEECKNLLVLVLIYDLDMIKESNLGNVLVNVRDYRVTPQYVAEVSQWEHAALKGGVDFWKRAEAVSRASMLSGVGCA